MGAYIVFAAIVAFLGVSFLWLHLGYLAYSVVGLADLYMILMIWSAAAKSSKKKKETWPGLPEIRPALLILLFEFLALVCAFGALYFVTANGTTSRFDAAYASFVSLVTFTD